MLSEDAISILIPVMEEILGWNASQIRSFYEQQDFILQEWEKVQTDTLNIIIASEEAGTDSGREKPVVIVDHL